MISNLANLFSIRNTVEIHQLHRLKESQELMRSKTLQWYNLFSVEKSRTIKVLKQNHGRVCFVYVFE